MISHVFPLVKNVIQNGRWYFLRYHIAKFKQHDINRNADFSNCILQIEILPLLNKFDDFVTFVCSLDYSSIIVIHVICCLTEAHRGYAATRPEQPGGGYLRNLHG